MAVISPSLWQAYGCDSTYVARRLYPAPMGGSTGSLPSTGKSHHSYIPFVRRYRQGRGWRRARGGGMELGW